MASKLDELMALAVDFARWRDDDAKDALQSALKAVVEECEAAKKEAEDYRQRWEAELKTTQSFISGGRYPDGSPAW